MLKFTLFSVIFRVLLFNVPISSVYQSPVEFPSFRIDESPAEEDLIDQLASSLREEVRSQDIPGKGFVYRFPVESTQDEYEDSDDVLGKFRPFLGGWRKTSADEVNHKSQFAFNPSDPRYYAGDNGHTWIKPPGGVSSPTGGAQAQPPQPLQPPQPSESGQSDRRKDNQPETHQQKESPEVPNPKGEIGDDKKDNSIGQIKDKQVPSSAPALNPPSTSTSSSPAPDEGKLTQHHSEGEGEEGHSRSNRTTSEQKHQPQTKLKAKAKASHYQQQQQSNEYNSQFQYYEPMKVAKGNSDLYFIGIVVGCSAAAIVGVIGVGVCWHRLQKNSKSSADVDYPAYGIIGPSRELSPAADRKLAQSAHMYHYQHQKQQMIAMESNGSAVADQQKIGTTALGTGATTAATTTTATNSNDNNNNRNSKGFSNQNGIANLNSDNESDDEDENEDGDYSVYECPGLAPPGEMEVRNPLYADDIPVAPMSLSRGVMTSPVPTTTSSPSPSSTGSSGPRPPPHR